MEKKFRLVDLKRKEVIVEGIHFTGEFMREGCLDDHINYYRGFGSYAEYLKYIRTDIFSGKQDGSCKDIYENDLVKGEHRDMGEIINLKVDFDNNEGFISVRNGLYYPFNKIKNIKIIGIHYGI